MRASFGLYAAIPGALGLEAATSWPRSMRTRRDVTAPGADDGHASRLLARGRRFALLKHARAALGARRSGLVRARVTDRLARGQHESTGARHRYPAGLLDHPG